MELDPTRLLSRRDALSMGLADHEIRALRTSGGWRTLHHGNYIGADHSDALDARSTHRLLIDAVLPTLSDKAVVSHESAAILHGLPLYGVDLSRVHVTRDRRGGGRTSKGVVTHCSPLGEVVIVDGFRTTTLARTLVDIARTMQLDTAVVLGDVAMRHGASLDEVAEELERARRWQGIASARRVADMVDARSESVAESLSRIRLHQNGFRDVELQVEVRDPRGRFLGRSDFGVTPAVMGECDGKVKYGKFLRPGQDPGDAVFEEKKREDSIRDTGLQVVRWTWSEIFTFDVVVDRIRRAIVRAENSPKPTASVRPGKLR